MKYRIAKIAVLTLLLVLGTYHSLFTIIAFLITFLLILLDKESLYVMLYLHSFSTIFNLSPDGMSFMTILMIVYVAVDILKYKRIDTSYFFVYALFAVYVIVFTLDSIYLSRTVKFLIGFLYIYFALQDVKYLKEKEICLHFIYGLILSSILVYFEVFHNLSAQKTLGYDYGYISRFSGLYVDPNCFSINITICLCLVFFLRTNKMIKTPSQLLITALLLTFCVMTLSKSAVLSLLIVLFVVVFYNFRQRKIENAIGILVLSVIGVVLLLNLNIPSIQILVDRLQYNDDLNSFTTGRFDLWKNYLQYLTSNLKVFLFGRGLCAELFMKAVHNTFLDCMYHLGFVGSLLLVSLCVELNKKTTNGRKNIINVSVFMCILFMYFGLSELFYFDLPIHLLLAAIIFRAPVDPKLYENDLQKGDVWNRVLSAARRFIHKKQTAIAE